MHFRIDRRGNRDALVHTKAVPTGPAGRKTDSNVSYSVVVYANYFFPTRKSTQLRLGQLRTRIWMGPVSQHTLYISGHCHIVYAVICFYSNPFKQKISFICAFF